MQLTPEQIESMRAIGLRLDRGGTFWHQGAPVTHARLREALLRWLDVLPDGRDIVRLDDKRYAYVEVEDAHVRARAARWDGVGDGARCWLTWDDGGDDEELDYASLRQAEDHAFYARARGGRLRGRIAGPAYYVVAEHVVDDGETGGDFVLVASGRRWPIANAG